MAVVYECDRCKQVYKKPFTIGSPKYDITKNNFPESVELDLCPKCLALLERFYQGTL